MKKAVVMFVLLSALAAVVAAQAPAVDAEKRAAVVDRLGETLREVYVFPEVAEKMDAYLHQRLGDQAYDKLDALPAFTQQLTEDLQSISHDLHLRVMPLPPADVNAEQEVDEKAIERRFLESMRLRNYGFEKLERLTGNVGYLDLRGFLPAEHAGRTAIAAMNFLAHCDALIIDLRQNGGGEPSMIQLISSYFFAEPQHLNSFYIRRDDTTQQFWTQAYVEGPRMTDAPIYVLTSRRTFSAAEEFTYNLKNMKRATIVGETTGGGAHPVDMHRFPELGVQASVPFGRAVNPITGTNWEGTGVEPDVAVPAAEALEVAHREALKKLLETATDPDLRFQLEWAVEGIDVKLHPVTLAAAELAAYAGVYGPRQVRLEDGKLYYQRDDGPVYELVPMGGDRFGLAGMDNFRIRFERGAGGKVVTLVGLYGDGSEEPSPRSDG